MAYLVDGHNLIPHIPGLSLAALDDEQDLIRLLQDFCRRNRKSVEVYFDRAPPGFASRRSYGRVTAFFVPQGTTADEAIRTRLKSLGKDARNWAVVSADHQVQAEARAAHARVIDSGDFANQLDTIAIQGGQTAKKAGTGDDLQEWLRLFGGEDKSDKSE